MMSKTQNTENWYQNPWVWLLIGIPLSSILFGVVMIVSATVYPDDVVVDDYYKEGMAINQRIDMDEAASRRKLEATGQFDKGRVSFEIEGAIDSAIVLSIFHVTDRNLDREVLLLPEFGGRYAADQVDLPLDEPGVWYIELAGVDDGWRLRRRVEAPVSTVELAADE